MPARQSYQQYTVVKGDTVAKIAKRFSSSVGAIAAASGLADANKIKVGQVLSIPISEPGEDEPAKASPASRPTSAPKSRPTTEVAPPVVSLGEYLQMAFRPPALYFTLAAIAGAFYYMSQGKPKRR